MREQSKPNNPFLVSIGEGYGAYSEITLRDLFAGMAMHAYSNANVVRDTMQSDDHVARMAYAMADALLEARGKQQ